MTRLFRWSMRHGAAILFTVAVAQFIVGLVPAIYELLSETGRMARNYDYAPGGAGMTLTLQLQLLAGLMVSSALPLFGALVIDRLDRWLALKDREAAE